MENIKDKILKLFIILGRFVIAVALMYIILAFVMFFILGIFGLMLLLTVLF